MNKTNILLFTALIILSTTSYSQLEHFIDIKAPSGLFNYNDTLYIGSYAGVSHRKNLRLPTSSETIFNSHVFRTTLHNRNLYYSDSWNYIFKYELDTGDSSVLFGDGSNIFGVTVHGNDLYYSEWELGEIWKIGLEDEIAIPELVYLGLDTLGSLIENNGNLYITESGSGSIFRMDLNSNYPRLDTLFYNEFSAPNELHVIGNYMYVSDFDANKISRFNLDNPKPIAQDVLVNIKSPTGLASDDQYLYISSFEKDEILRFPLDIIPSYDKVNTRDPILIYPNPNYGKFSVSNLDKKEAYKIYDANGKLIQSGLIGNNEEIELREKQNKTLFIKIKDSGLIKILILK